jgi:periplasmic divalent cation tolerance protein
MSEFLSLYVTSPSREVAEKIGRTLVEERLAACVNIIAATHSIYWWKGTIEEATEVVLIAKSRAAHFEELEKRISELHPYGCPCMAWPIAAGHRPYLDWVAQETAS